MILRRHSLLFRLLIRFYRFHPFHLEACRVGHDHTTYVRIS